MVQSIVESFYLRNNYMMMSVEQSQIISLCQFKFLIISTYLHSITLVCQHRCSDSMLCDLPSVSVSVCDLVTST